MDAPRPSSVESHSLWWNIVETEGKGQTRWHKYISNISESYSDRAGDLMFTTRHAQQVY